VGFEENFDSCPTAKALAGHITAFSGLGKNFTASLIEAAWPGISLVMVCDIFFVFGLIFRLGLATVTAFMGGVQIDFTQRSAASAERGMDEIWAAVGHPSLTFVGAGLIEGLGLLGTLIVLEIFCVWVEPGL
jgi:hypothetical protein